MVAPTTQFLRTREGHSIAYQIVGEGPVDIVFHPLFGCVDMFWEDPEYEYFLRRLAGLGRLILFDVRGIGASDRLPLGSLPTPQAWVEDLRVVLDAVHSESPAIIGAGTFGIMDMVFAATFPQRVRALVLIDSFARWLTAPDYPLGGTAEGLETLTQAFRQAWGTGFSTVMSTPSRSKDPTFLQWVARTERMTATADQVSAYWNWALQLDVRDVLPVVQAPTLVIHNHPNNIATKEHAKYLADHIPNATFLELERRNSYLFDRRAGDEILGPIEEFLTGSIAPRTDASLATVLFTDVVGSTEHATRLGDRAWSDLLVRHNEIITRELERHRGQQVVPTGDGLLATFDGPERAIACALRVRDAVREFGLEVRIGMHTGRVQRRGRNIHGLAVHIGHRITQLAAPGEVLVSSTVRDLVAGSDIRFVDRGKHDLKGMSDRWQVFGVV